MKRTHSNMSDGEAHEPNKRIKVADEASGALQWFEVDDLLGLFIQLVFSDTKLLVNLAATSKAFWRQLHSKTAWQAAGFSLYYAEDQITKREFRALLRRKQFPLDASKIAVDVASSDRNKNIGAVCHLSRILETDAEGVAVDPIALSLATVTIMPRILDFIDVHDCPTLQIASIDILALKPDVKFVKKLNKVITTTKSRDVKHRALWALSNQLALRKELSAQVIKNEELIRTIIETFSLDGVIVKISSVCLQVLSYLDYKNCPWTVIEPAIAPILKIISSSSDSELIASACDALASIAQERAVGLIKPVVNKIIDLLLVNNSEVQSSCLKLLCQICLTGDAAMDLEIITNPNLFPACKTFLQSAHRLSRIRTQQLLANLATNALCIQHLLNSDLMPLILKPNADFADVEVGLLSIVINMFSDGDAEQCRKLVQMGAVPYFSFLLSHDKKSNIQTPVLLDTVKAIGKLFRVSKENGFYNEVIETFESTNGIDMLEHLQLHTDLMVYNATFAALEQIDLEFE